MISRGLFISDHALLRYRERVEPCADDEEVARRLSTDAIVCAANFGAPCVRLSGGQRVILDADAVVTVLPTGARDHRPRGTPRRVRGRLTQPSHPPSHSEMF